jgi:hypothetical protein
MIVELHERLHKPLKVPASRVLITADDGTPIVFVVEFASGKKSWWRCFRAGDDDFQEQLRLHGIDRTVLVTNLDQKTLAPVLQNRA